MELILDIFNIVTAAVALASGIAAVTPTPKDDEWVAKAARGGNHPISAEAVAETANTSTPDLTASASNAIIYP